ncbi:MAG TPA: thermostable hemolysin [Casimicrobiaceae bacterium]|nr:thermostable hemolysin [Casimicrobiaceae bacterium]
MPAASSACSTAAEARIPRRRLDAIERDDPRRAAIEGFVAGVYRRHYGARIAHFAPTLVALCTDGRLAAAAGYRRALEPLYLEHYLDVPVEAAIAAHTGHRVSRSDIWEVGHFASTQPGEGRRLMQLLARHLAGLGCRWVVSTATRELRELLIRVGLTPYALAPADPSRVPEGAAHWGGYYEHAPVVIAGDLPRALATLARHRNG